MGAHYLRKLFEPEAIAVFGASEGPESVGGGLFRNLQEGGFEGRLYPVNPRHDRVFGVDCRPDLAGVEARIDLAVIATPREAVIPALRDCGAHGIGVAIVVTGGFGEPGRALERELVEAARACGIRVLGPNCLGVMRPGRSLNATFGLAPALAGRIGLISQSAALCTAILDWAAPRRIGFSAVASPGAGADLDLGDLIDYLAYDPDTRSILLYLEGLRRARPFLSALRSAARVKPVIVIKAGRRESGSRAALAHTGALAGDDDAFDAALDRAGAVRVATIGQLFSAAQILSEYAGEAGRRLAIVSNAGGPGVLAADRAADLAIELPAPDRALQERLAAALPTGRSRANPLEILGDAPPARYAAAISACLDSPLFDGVLVILTPQAMSAPLAAAEAVIEARARTRRPVLACWMGGERVEAARRRFYEARVPHFPSPEGAVDAFSYLVRRRRNRELLLQVPGPRPHTPEPDVAGAAGIIDEALGQGRRVLSGMESRAVLRPFGLPVGGTATAASAGEAAVAAEAIGYPVAMKVDSPDLPQGADAGGVHRDLPDAGAVRRAHDELVAHVVARWPDARVPGVTLESMPAEPAARELMIGVARDAVFGPVLRFGAGGTAGGILRDRTLALPPLNEFIAERMIADTGVAAMLGDWRDLPGVERAALVQALLDVSALACELPQVVALELDPLMASPAGVRVRDARIVVEPPAASTRPYGHMAIHPFPAHRVEWFRTAAGEDVTIRPIRPEDAQIEQAFVRDLSEGARYLRFMSTMKELSREALVRFTQIDYDREMALIAVAERDGREVQLGVARYIVLLDGEGCELAIVVADEFQGTGLGTRLLRALIDAARDRGLRWMESETFATNEAMRALAQRTGFTARPRPDDASVLHLHRTL